MRYEYGDAAHPLGSKVLHANGLIYWIIALAWGASRPWYTLQQADYDDGTVRLFDVPHEKITRIL